MRVILRVIIPDPIAISVYRKNVYIKKFTQGRVWIQKVFVYGPFYFFAKINIGTPFIIIYIYMFKIY